MFGTLFDISEETRIFYNDKIILVS